MEGENLLQEAFPLQASLFPESSPLRLPESAARRRAKGGDGSRGGKALFFGGRGAYRCTAHAGLIFLYIFYLMVDILFLLWYNGIGNKIAVGHRTTSPGNECASRNR